MNNEIKVNVPEGMEIDKEHSTFECIKFKPKWIPKRGDIAAVGSTRLQIILVGEYIKSCDIVGFDVMGLAVLDTSNNHLTIMENIDLPLWVDREASASEKELLINKLKDVGYIYDPDNPKIIYKKEKELPKTWEEFCENNPIKTEEVFVSTSSDIQYSNNFNLGKRDSIIDANMLPSVEYAKAMLALCKLIQLRDCYNDGWKANWNDNKIKYVIYTRSNTLKTYRTQCVNYILNFKTEGLRDTFLNNFIDLIEQAKLLL